MYIRLIHEKMIAKIAIKPRSTKIPTHYQYITMSQLLLLDADIKHLHEMDMEYQTSSDFPNDKVARREFHRVVLSDWNERWEGVAKAYYDGPYLVVRKF